MTTFQHNAFAGLWHRFLGLAVDFLVFCVFFFPITRVVNGTWVMGVTDHRWHAGAFVTDPLCLAFLVIIAIYFILLEGLTGATVGKLMPKEEFTKASHRRRDPKFFVLHQPESELATPARGRSVSYFCGKCHSQITEKHLGSSHGNFGEPTCLYCHGQGSHLIPQATSAIIEP